jgi:2-oxo-4-hydroxy-4-carboxy-5-ureidoimidazoline decarboxylase
MDGESMTIEEFDRLDPAAAAEVLATCAAIDTWVEPLVRDRPFGTREALLEAAAASAADWTNAEVDAALAHHPRIGERPDTARLGAANSEHSAREQAGMATAAVDLRAAIAAGNLTYEARFGRVFLIRAAGRSPEQILAELTTRLDNDDATEDAVVARELGQIALLRLGRAVAA